MTNDIQLFHSDQFGDIRALAVNDEPWFVAKDLADALSYGNTGQLTRILNDDEKGMQILHTPGGDQQFSMVSESGFYHAVLQRRSSWIQDKAKRANVEAFQRWVTHEVLPALRRDGAYVASDGTEDDATLMARALIAANRTIEANRRALEQQRERIAVLVEDTERMRPMADYAETTLDAVGCITITDAARQLKQQDPTIGQRRLFGLLRADGLICLHSNQATSKAIERDYLRNVQKSYLDSEGVRHLREPYAVVTPKGLAWMLKRYCRQTAIV